MVLKAFYYLQVFHFRLKLTLYQDVVNVLVLFSWRLSYYRYHINYSIAQTLLILTWFLFTFSLIFRCHLPANWKILLVSTATSTLIILSYTLSKLLYNISLDSWYLSSNRVQSVDVQIMNVTGRQQNRNVCK